MNTQIIPVTSDQNRKQLLPPDIASDAKYRLDQFVTWLDTTGGHWHAPNLEAYKTYLLSDERIRVDSRTGKEHRGALSPRTVQAHLSSIRGRYNAILKDNGTRDRLYQMTPSEASAADRKAFVDEMLERLKNGIDPDKAKVKVETVQDTADDEHLRLSRGQANALINAPMLQDGDKLMGLRNQAIIALMLCTGIREMELCNLEVKDLRQTMSGELALHVRKGKGCKTRLVPYGDLDGVLVIVDTWLHMAGITSGPVFRGLYKDGKSLRPGKIHVRAINQILARYPIAVNGHKQTVNPHDLRRTYARRAYDEGMDILAIQQNLGHSDHKTTLKYIGVSDVQARRTRGLYDLDLAALKSFKLIDGGVS